MSELWGDNKCCVCVLACVSTHIQVTDSEGQYMVRTSCGTEGFKNARKSTPIAAQTAGISAAAVRCASLH